MFQKLILETFFGGILELLASVDVHSGRETVQDPPSLPVGKQGWWLHVTTEQGQRAGAEGSSHGRAEGSMCGSPIFFPLSPFYPGAPCFFLSTRPCALMLVSAMVHTFFFFPTRPEHLNRSKATPYSPTSWRHQRSKLLHAPMLKCCSGDTMRTP
jgi:hypothetical protein